MAHNHVSARPVSARIPANTTISRWLAGLVVFIAVACGLPASSAQATDGDFLFTVRDVAVDVTAANAAVAREDAIEQGQRIAFRRLTSRLLTQEEIDRLELPDDNELAGMIHDFEINDEKLSSVRYIAQLTFRFKPDPVRDFLAEKGYRFSSAGSKPVLVLPFYQTGSRTVIWDDPNPWRDAWHSARIEEGLVPVRVPLGDLQDMRDVPGDRILGGSEKSLDSITRRYGAGDAIFAIAFSKEANPDPSKGIQVFLYRMRAAGAEYITTIEIAPNPGDTLDALLKRGVQAVHAHLQREWKSQIVSDPSAKGEITVYVTLGDLRDWVRTRDRLERIKAIQALDLLSLSRDEAKLALRFRGGEERLRLALSQHDINLGPPRLDFSSPDNRIEYELFLSGRR